MKHIKVTARHRGWSYETVNSIMGASAVGWPNTSWQQSYASVKFAPKLQIIQIRANWWQTICCRIYNDDNEKIIN